MNTADLKIIDLDAIDEAVEAARQAMPESIAAFERQRVQEVGARMEWMMEVLAIRDRLGGRSNKQAGGHRWLH